VQEQEPEMAEVQEQQTHSGEHRPPIDSKL
jgi:hypothetical protein